MPRYFIEFSYDGSSYHGLQKQPNSETIQECIEFNMSKFLGLNIDLTLAGRTDTGVHARQMFAHFDIDIDFSQDNFCRSLNMMLPLANMFGYINTLRSMSQGRAQYSMTFDHYEQVPQAVADEVRAKMA